MVAQPTFLLDDTIRGVPPGHPPLPPEGVATLGWHPTDGRMALPLLSLDLAAFAANAAAMMAVVRHYGIAIAPHAKTSMCPPLMADLLDAGAWGTSVADIRQASVMLRSGLRRIVVANEIGGPAAARRLAALLANHPDAETYVFVDSPDAVDALDLLWRTEPGLPCLHLLIEVTCGRGGVRTVDEVDALAARITASSRLCLAGVAAYEGTANRPDPAETGRALDALFDLTAAALSRVRRHAGPDAPLILTAGGSSLFDHVIASCLPIATADGNTTVLLRSGSCFYGDHGTHLARLEAVVARGLLADVLSPERGNPFKPALRLWAEILSHAEPGLAICGLGLRDTSHDQGSPIPLHLWRAGMPVRSLPDSARVTKLNDQHAFLSVAPDIGVQVGDIVEFGIVHPCTCFDKHQVIWCLGGNGLISAVHRTHFG